MKKVVYVFCGPRERFRQSNKESFGIGIDKKNEIPEVLVRSVMRRHEGAKTGARVDSELSEEFEVKLGMH